MWRSGLSERWFAGSSEWMQVLRPYSSNIGTWR